MLRPTHTPDPARLVTALGIPVRPPMGADQLLADLESLKQRRITLGLWAEPAPMTEAERADRLQRAREALAVFAAEARAERIARGHLWETHL